MSFNRTHNRRFDEIRPLTIELGVQRHAEGSALVKAGETHVLCAASVEARVPPFLAGSGRGWVTAEYAMLPRATHTRGRRENQGGARSLEIQRLIGRCLRAVIALDALGERSITIDCDVLQADGGTRTAAITGGFVALALALDHVGRKEGWTGLPLRDSVAAISVGRVGGRLLLDLEYEEDSRAEVDLNVAATGNSQRLIEVQGSGESATFDRSELNAMLDLAQVALNRITEIQRQVLAQTLFGKK